MRRGEGAVSSSQTLFFTAEAARADYESQRREQAAVIDEHFGVLNMAFAQRVSARGAAHLYAKHAGDKAGLKAKREERIHNAKAIYGKGYKALPAEIRRRIERSARPSDFPVCYNYQALKGGTAEHGIGRPILNVVLEHLPGRELMVLVDAVCDDVEGLQATGVLPVGVHFHIQMAAQADRVAGAYALSLVYFTPNPDGTEVQCADKEGKPVTKVVVCHPERGVQMMSIDEYFAVLTPPRRARAPAAVPAAPSVASALPAHDPSTSVSISPAAASSGDGVDELLVDPPSCRAATRKKRGGGLQKDQPGLFGPAGEGRKGEAAPPPGWVLSPLSGDRPARPSGQAGAPPTLEVARKSILSQLGKVTGSPLHMHTAARRPVTPGPARTPPASPSRRR